MSIKLRNVVSKKEKLVEFDFQILRGPEIIQDKIIIFLAIRS